MIQFTINSFSHGNQAARINQSMKLYKTVATLFGVIKKLNLRLVLGTARKKILKDIAKTTNVRL